MQTNTAPLHRPNMRPEGDGQAKFHNRVQRDCRFVLENTIKPFEPGDVLLGCTWLNDPTDDHAGLGRILQYDRELKLKGILWTEGHRHLIIGLTFDRSGVLWGFDVHTQAVIRVDRYARQLPMHHFAARAFGAAVFASDGSIYFGENLKGDQPYWGSYMTYLPGTNRVGDGHIFKYDKQWNCVAEYPTETAPELSGFKGVTHLALHPSEKFITYCTETGKRLMRYDIVNARQLPDLASIDGDDLYDRQWFIALAYAKDGRCFVTRGDYFEALDEQGKVLRSYSLKEFGYGFAQITVCADQQHVLTASVWTGVAVKVNLDTGVVVGVIETDHKSPRRSLAGIAEFAG
jgi:hypothetical protein